MKDGKGCFRDQEVGTDDVQLYFFKIKNTETSLNVSREGFF